MKIAIIGAGAMGSLFGGYLSKQNEVTLIDTSHERVELIEQNGFLICEQNGDSRRYQPRAVTGIHNSQPADLVVLFVKSLFSRAALEANRALLGPDTYLLTLQNGAGHDRILREFAQPSKIIIGTTQHNASLTPEGNIYHGGGGKTYFGLLEGDSSALCAFSNCFTACGFDTALSDNIQKLIWKKLFVNVSVSVLTGVLQMKMGYMLDNRHARWLHDQLLREAVAVANGDGMGFDAEEILEANHTLLKNAHDGYTSIYADLRDGRKTEVDTISGAVVQASLRNGVPAPSHTFIVELVHAMEDRNGYA